MTIDSINNSSWLINPELDVQIIEDLKVELPFPSLQLAAEQQRQYEELSRSSTRLKKVASFFGFKEGVALPAINWEGRKKRLGCLSGNVWYDIVHFLGPDKIRQRTSNASLCAKMRTRLKIIPSPYISWQNGLTAESSLNEWKIHLGKTWLLEESDLPLNWKELNFLQLHAYLAIVLRNNKITQEDSELIEQLKHVTTNEPPPGFLSKKQKALHDELSLILPIHEAYIFINLVTRQEWEAARKGVIAHELAHISGSTANPNDESNTYQDRMYEKEADYIAASLPDKSIKKGLITFIGIMAIISTNADERKIIDIAKQKHTDTHPTAYTRLHYLASF